MSSMPRTALLLTNNDIVVGHFNNYSEIGYHMGISIDDGGVITFQGKKQNPSYVIDPDKSSIVGNHFTKHGAISDWCRCHMAGHMGGHQVYRYLA